MKNRKWFKAIVGVAMALTMTFGATTQKVPFFNDNSTVITAEAASISWHWQSYDIYLTHNEAQLVGRFYSVLPSLVGNCMPSVVKNVIKDNAKKIQQTDCGNGVRIHMTRWSPLTTNAFLTGIYPR